MPRLVVALTVALTVVASAAAGVQRVGPTPLTDAVTVRCNPPLETPVDELVPRPLMAFHAGLSGQLGGVLIWRRLGTQFTLVGPKTFWWNRNECRKVTLPKRLPSASLVRLPEPSITCLIPGRYLLMHAARRNGVNSLSLRAMPHGQLILHVELVGKTVRSYASRYAVRLCELHA